MKIPLFVVSVVLVSDPVFSDGVMDETSVNRKEWFDTLPVIPLLNTPLLYGRMTTDELNGTGSILALIYEQGITGQSVYPWPLYVQLDSSHDRGDATGVNTRYYSRGAGWGAAIHGEGRVYGSGTVIGSNLEMTTMPGSDSRVIGVNVQAKNGLGYNPSYIWSNHAINIQSGEGTGWNEGIRFDKGVHTKNGIYFDPESWGQRAIYVNSEHYKVGVETGAAPVAVSMNAGSKVCLERTRQICVKFNPDTNRIEFMHGENSLGYIATDVYSNKCLNCTNRSGNSED